MTTGATTIFPVLRYRDADAAVEWLMRAFGFTQRAVTRHDDGTILHAELQLGTGIIMLGQHRADDWMGGTAPDPNASPMGLYVRVDDPDAHFARAKGAGAEITMELVDQDYGSREYAARDPEGIVWSFGTYDPYAATPAAGG
jgi:uncharacterized glyoxalase superfamily protein PhnB